MNRQDTETRVNRVIHEQLNVEVEKIKPESILTVESGVESNLCTDSLSFVEVLLGIEEEFDLDILDEDATNFKTVKDLVDYVHGIKAAGLKTQIDPNGNPIKPCCDNECRNINGGCDNCGAPCL